MSLEFEPVGHERRKDYIHLLDSCPLKFSDISFINLWAWADEYGLSWAWDNDLVWIRQSRPEICFWPPVGPWETIDWQAAVQRHFTSPAVFTRIPDQLIQVWNSRLSTAPSVQDAREHWDYLYNAQDLIQLKGGKLHKKKNLLNQFKKTYAYSYGELTAESIQQVLDMQTGWCVWKDCESSETLAAENRAIERVLRHLEFFDTLTGGCIMSEDVMVAYTVAEKLTADTVLIHFEKADPDYKGAYQAINQMFLEYSAPEVLVVNREQDLGDSGLRRAKLSYGPVDFIRKYRVTLRTP